MQRQRGYVGGLLACNCNSTRARILTLIIHPSIDPLPLLLALSLPTLALQINSSDQFRQFYSRTGSLHLLGIFRPSLA